MRQAAKNHSRLLRLYYSNRLVLFTACAGNELFFMSLYMAKSAALGQQRLARAHRALLLASAPIMAYKQWMNLLQLARASQGLAALGQNMPAKRAQAK